MLFQKQNWLSHSITVAALSAVLALGVAACGDDDSAPDNGPYSLTFHGEGYTIHQGQALSVAVVDVATDQIIATDQVVLSSDTFSFTWMDLLEKDRAYRIDFFADLTGDGECNDSPEDHGWSVSVPSVTADQDVEQDHTTDFSSVCGSFPSGPQRFDVAFNGTGYGPHDMQTLYAALVRVDNGNVVETAETVVSSGTFSISWPAGVEEDKSYRIDFFADMDDDGLCADPDHIWSVAIPTVTGNVSVDETHNLNFTPAACDSFDVALTFDLTFDGVSYAPHNGDDLYLAVVRTDDSEVLATDMVNISGGEFSFSWTDILEEGTAYHIDFYADTDDNGTCGGADHIWREVIPAVTDDVTVVNTHGIIFEPLACDSF